MAICGFDFGTSNSAIGVVKAGEARLVNFGEAAAIRSAIFVDFEERSLKFGQPAVEDYLLGLPGRLITSLKSVLGSSLMEAKTPINGEWLEYTEVLGLLLRHIKERAEKHVDEPLAQVVLGRPVRFSDDDDERDARAANTLASIARDIGFDEVAFQFEPVAAALSFEAQMDSEQLACVVDLGGGTADFSIIRLGPERRSRDRNEDVLANHGVHIGGTDLDYRLSLATVMLELGLKSKLRGSSGIIELPTYYYHELSRWHRIFDMYDPKVRQSLRELLAVAIKPARIRRLLDLLDARRGHYLLAQVEKCKEALSSTDTHAIELPLRDAEVICQVTRGTFERAIAGEVERLEETLRETITRAGINKTNIDCAFLTGGTGLVPTVREALTRVLAPIVLVPQDPFTAVAHGLTLDAKERFSS